MVVMGVGMARMDMMLVVGGSRDGIGEMGTYNLLSPLAFVWLFFSFLDIAIFPSSSLVGSRAKNVGDAS